MAPLALVAPFLALVLPFVAAVPQSKVQPQQAASTLTPIFFLAGDSTTHFDAGWGDGFLATVRSPADGINYGASGTTLESFRSKGLWGQILGNITKYKATRECLVTIQFGHNDQKNPTDEAAYSANLQQYVVDVNTAGGIPIVVTPLCRRDFSAGVLVRNLAVETAKALVVANTTGSRFIDLNYASCKFVETIGQKASTAYNYDGTDRTHLNPWGKIVFGRMVSDLLVDKYSDVAAVTIANATMTALLDADKPV